MVSYLFYLSDRRQSVFAQQLRFLAKREDLSDSEAVVIWHGSLGQADLSSFKSNTIDCFKSEKYNKNIMVNRAVGLAKGEVLVIIDADRIMPEGYFKKTIKELTPGTATAPDKMIKLLSPVSDAQINNRQFTFRRDDRTRELTPFRKHLFSGNTVLFKEDYLATGGMDESYWGYGFNDLDFSKVWERKGFKIDWSPEEEIHLYHDRLDQADEDEFHTQNTLNAYKFFKKWNEPLPDKFRYDLANRAVPVL